MGRPHRQCRARSRPSASTPTPCSHRWRTPTRRPARHAQPGARRPTPSKELNPTVIYCHTTMWGNDGPRATWPGFDQLGQSSCGLEYELGGEGNPPNWYRFGMCDQACATQSALAVLMALYWRELTGEGQKVDTSIVHGGVHFNTDAWIGPDGTWSERPRSDKEQAGLGPLYRLYRTSDGWVALACLGNSHWQALAKVVPGLDGDDRFRTHEGRAENGAALQGELEQFFA